MIIFQNPLVEEASQSSHRTERENEQEKNSRRNIVVLKIHKRNQIELITTGVFKKLIHIPSFYTDIFVKLIAQSGIDTVAIKHRTLGI